MGISPYNVFVGTLQGAITRGDDLLIYEASTNNPINDTLTFDTSIYAVAIGTNSHFDQIGLVWECPVPGNDGSVFNQEVSVGVGSPFFGRIPINGALGETISMNVVAAQNTVLGTGYTPDDRRSYNAPSAYLQIYFYVKPPLWVPQKRSPLTISCADILTNDFPSGIGIWCFGRRFVDFQFWTEAQRDANVRLTIVERKGLAENTLMDKQYVVELAAAAGSSVRWTREAPNMPDYIYVTALDLGIEFAPVRAYAEARD